MKDSDWQFLRQLYLTPNITKAANALFISQPALTKRLQSIESEMSVQIVHRNKTGLEFTPEGEYLARQAIRYFEFLNETHHHLDMLRSNHQASISIASSLSYLKYNLPDVISRYNQLYPDIRFDITGGRSSEVLGSIINGTIDFGIIRSQPTSSVEAIELNHETGCILTKTPVTLGEIETMPRIDFPLNSYCSKLVEDWWNMNFKEPPTIGMTVQHMDQTWPMVEKGLGYCICFLPNNRAEVAALRPLYITPIVDENGLPITRTTYLVYSNKRILTTQQQCFISFMREEARS